MEEKDCLSRLQKLCSKAEYCEADVYKKALKYMDSDAEAAARITRSLVEERYVDDLRYAGAYVREKANIQGWGPVKIRFQLRAKGVSEADIAAGLAEVEPAAAADKLSRVLAAKARTLEGDPQRRLKLIKFGLSRGYEYDAVEAALKEVL
jgi:regulatory protein